jgi:hypothetical protein
MTEREFERRMRGFYKAEVRAGGRVPVELRESVWAIPDDVPIEPRLFASRRPVLLLAAAMLLALVVSTAIAVGAGLIPWLEEEPDTELVPPALSWARQGPGSVGAGAYFVDVARESPSLTPPTIRIRFTLPQGWERVSVPRLLWGGAKWMGFGVFHSLYVDPCHPHRGSRELPQPVTSDDVVAGMAALPGWAVTSTTPASVGGYDGLRVAITAPPDSSECPSSSSRLMRIHGLYNFMTAIRESERMVVWILDVGDRLVVIRVGHELWASEADHRQLQAVIDSIVIEPFAP